MTTLAKTDPLHPSNPLDLLEELVTANGWAFDRASDFELAVQVQGDWIDYQIWSCWQEDLHAVYFACRFDARVPPAKRRQVEELIALFNEKLWLGHFDYAADDGTVMFRHTVPLRGTPGASVEQLEDLLDTAVMECERFYPALQLVVWGGQPGAEAVAAVMMETVGEA